MEQRTPKKVPLEEVDQHLAHLDLKPLLGVFRHDARLSVAFLGENRLKVRELRRRHHE